MATTKQGGEATPEVADTTTKERPKLAPAPALSAACQALVDKALKANGGKFPVRHYDVKTAFGHTYPAADYTDHTVEWVKQLIWELRTSADKPSYRSIAEALGIQCSAITEAVTHAVGRKKEHKADDSWKVATGGRVKYLQDQEAPAPKPRQTA